MIKKNSIKRENNIFIFSHLKFIAFISYFSCITSTNAPFEVNDFFLLHNIIESRQSVLRISFFSKHLVLSIPTIMQLPRDDNTPVSATRWHILNQEASLVKYYPGTRTLCAGTWSEAQ